MLCSLPALLGASGFFSGSETALFSLNNHQRLQMRRSGTIAGTIVAQLLDETRTLLITLLLSNMIINVLYFVVTTVLIIHLKHSGTLGAVGAFVSGLMVLVVLIICGEVLPKLVAARAAARWSRLAAAPLLAVHRAMSPLRAVLNALVITPLARLIAPRHKPTQLSGDELETLIHLSQQRGVIDPSEEQLLQQVLELGQLKASDLMTPRVDMQAFDLSGEPAELIALIRRTHFRHIPVYRTDPDHIAGVIYSRQVALRPPASAAAIETLTRQVRFVPEQQRADRLLLDMRRTGATFAIVVDEYGGTAGLVTLEDVVEHVVGDIAGPHDSA